VTRDLEHLRYNTAVAALMTYLNTLHERDALYEEEVTSLLLLLAPFAPHLAEELWARLDKPYSVHQQQLPVADPALLESVMLPVAVQVNGRSRGMIQLSPEASQAEALAAARQVDAARKILDSGSVERVIYVPRRIINLVSTS
jgi:leucyl-tRNA synthetase